MNEEQVLKGDLKDIYHRVMNTTPEKKDNTKKEPAPASPNITQTVTPQAPPQAQPSAGKKPEPTTVDPPKEGTPAPITQKPIIATKFAYSAKNPLKPKAPEKPKIPEVKKPQDTTKEVTKVASQTSRIPLIAGGMFAFAIIWGVIWALMFGLL